MYSGKFVEAFVLGDLATDASAEHCPDCGMRRYGLIIHGSTGSGSPAGSYTVTVTATSATGGTTITHTLPLTVVIQ
jgi:hypothetical protein